MADKTPLSELRDKLKIMNEGTRSQKGDGKKGPKVSKLPQVARDIRKNFRKTV
jgi:hypothetical protein